MDKKNVIMIVIVVVCLVLAGAFAIKNFGGGGDTSTSAADQGSQSMLCINPDCGHVFEMTIEERRQIMREQGRMMRRGGPPVFICPQCSEESAYQANNCSKCSTIFIRDYSSGDFADRCPECGYSAIEERRQQKGK